LHEWYALAARGRQQQRVAAADERISWQPRSDISGSLQRDAHRQGFGIRHEAWWGIQNQLGAAASTKAVWWDLHLARLLMHLLWPPYVTGGPL